MPSTAGGSGGHSCYRFHSPAGETWSGDSARVVGMILFHGCYGDALLVTDRRMGLRPEGLLPVVLPNVVDKHIREKAREYECEDEIDDMYA